MCDLHFLLYVAFGFGFLVFLFIFFNQPFYMKRKWERYTKIATGPVRAVIKVVISHFQTKCCI